eukprot:1160054-Pelagomonas_calceolata.AAC.3
MSSLAKLARAIAGGRVRQHCEEREHKIQVWTLVCLGRHRSFVLGSMFLGKRLDPQIHGWGPLLVTCTTVGMVGLFQKQESERENDTALSRVSWGSTITE